MFQHLASATPCPTSASGLPVPTHNRRGSFVPSELDDTCTLTTEIEFTRVDFQHDSRAVRPRRRRTVARKAPQSTAGITIFEDLLEDQELEICDELPSKLAGRTLLGRKAVRVPVQKAVVDQAKEEPSFPRPLGEIGQARKQSRPQLPAGSIMDGPVPPSKTHEYVSSSTMDRAVRRNERAGEGNGLKKNPRRRTIFVPTDETTMLTIHPGADTTARLDDTFHLPGLSSKYPPAAPEHEQQQYVAAERVVESVPPARRPRMSLAGAPKRLPLQQMVAKDHNLPSFDVEGQNGGKENLAPRRLNVLLDKQKRNRPNEHIIQHVSAKDSALLSSRLFEATAASQAKQNVVPRNAAPMRRPPVKVTTQSQQRPTLAPTHFTSLEHCSAVSGVSSIRSPMIGLSPPSSTDQDVRQAVKKRTGPQAPRGPAPKTSRLLQYPVLSEDICQPQMYEESWLGHQEISFTELVNEVFASAHTASFDNIKGCTYLREQMIEIYHQPTVNTMHKRLQASLLYGALARPKGVTSSPHPAHDIGLRKRFLSLWLDNYTEDALRAAAEVVTGRQLAPKTDTELDGLELSENLLDPIKSRRALTGFLETFFVCVEDIGADMDNNAVNLEGQRWRKTVLRSLMLIWLLDQAKASGRVEGCLFKSTATKKSSAIVLACLSSMLIPGVGNITRTLRHLDYEVCQTQDPLDEVVYHVENLAVDLRDGILLARLMEILLFSSVVRAQHVGDDATVTIQMPDATILESAFDQVAGSHYPRVLSRHLKMPCLGRVQKLYNVQVALSALDQVAGLSNAAAQDLTADDVVDGHREKTLAFLWALVSTHGLSRLVDWEELKRDTQRAQARTVPSTSHPESDADSLMTWAAAHGKHNQLNITNLTTSFANGDAYTAILDAFASVLPPTNDSSRGRGGQPRLESRLRAIGCSTPFIKQLSTPRGLIPSHTTTISNLVFLASRLLPLSRRLRAATALQRFFRHRLSKAMISRRAKLMRLAHSCAAVVCVRHRVKDAATVLQRSWRAVLQRRIDRLNDNVRCFQAVARAWGLRKALGQENRRLESRGPRVMGGW